MSIERPENLLDIEHGGGTQPKHTVWAARATTGVIIAAIGAAACESAPSTTTSNPIPGAAPAVDMVKGSSPGGTTPGGSVRPDAAAASVTPAKGLGIANMDIVNQILAHPNGKDSPLTSDQIVEQIFAGPNGKRVQTSFKQGIAMGASSVLLNGDNGYKVVVMQTRGMDASVVVYGRDNKPEAFYCPPAIKSDSFDPKYLFASANKVLTRQQIARGQ